MPLETGYVDYLENEGTTVSPVQEDDVAAYAGTIAAYTGAVDPIEAATGGRGLLANHTPEDAVQVINSKFSHEYWKASEDWMQETLTGAQEIVAADVAAQYVTNQENVTELLTSPYPQESALQLALRSGDRIDRETAALHHGQMLIAEGLMSQGWEWVPNIAGLVFIPDAVKDLYDFWGFGKEVLFNSEEEVVSKLWAMRTYYNNLQPDDKVAFQKASYEQALQSADGNEIKAAILMATLLDPGIDQVQFERSIAKLNDGLAGLGIYQILAPFIKASYMGFKVSRLAKQGAALNREKVAENTAAALEDATQAGARGTTQNAAASTAHPGSGFSVIDAGTIEGEAGEVAKVLATIDERRKAAQSFLQPLLNRQYLEPKLLLPEERAALETVQGERLLDYYRARYEGYGDIVADAKVIGRTEDEFTLQLSFDVPVLGKKNFTYTAPYTRDGIPKGTNIVDLPKLYSSVLSPEWFIPKTLRSTMSGLTRVDEATAIKYSQAFVAEQLIKSAKESYRGLSRKESELVDNVLMVGDEFVDGAKQGTTFTVEQLLSGVTVKDAWGNWHTVAALSPKQIAAYYARRDVYDGTWQLLNRIEREKFAAEGFMEVSVPLITPIKDAAVNAKRWWDERTVDLIGKPYFIKSFNDMGQLMAGAPKKLRDLLNTHGKVKVWTADKGDGYSGGTKINWNILQEYYQDGYVLIRNHPRNAQLNEAGKAAKYDFSLVQADKIRPLRRNVLQYKEGYVPRIAAENRYFIVKTERIRRNGVEDVDEEEVIRAFNQKADAVDFVKNSKSDVKLHIQRFDGIQFDKSGALTPDQKKLGIVQEDLILQEAGGLFIDGRSARGIKFGMQGGKAPRISPTKALERQLNYVSTNLPMAQWRVSVVDEFTKRYGNYLLDPTSWRSGLKEAPGVPGASTAKAVYNWIQDQLMLPTSSERAFRTRWANMAEWMQGKPLVGRNIAGWAFDMHQKDPFGAIRAINFHALLGMFNPAQFFVQAQGAALMWSMYPTRAPRLTHTYLALRGAASTTNQAAWKEIYRYSGVKAYMTEAEFVDLVAGFRQTGMMQAVHAGDANLNAATNGFHIDQNMFGKILDKGLLIYKEGESYVRGYAYILARENWMAANPGKVIGRAEQLEILEMATKKMLNLTSANRAYWQRGAWSIPTQFQQIAMKYLEAVWPKMLGGTSKFSASDKRRIMLGQVALYGAAGVPFGYAMLQGAASLAGADPDDVDGTALAYATNGMVAAMVEMYTGETLDLGRRGAALSGVQQVVDDIFIKEMPWTKFAFGASRATGDRFVKFFQRLQPLMPTSEVEATSTEVLMALTAGARVFSSVNNYMQGRMWQNTNKILAARGDVLTAEQVENFDAIVTAKKLGFQSAVVSDTYSVKRFNYERSQEDKEALRIGTELALEYLRSGDIDDATVQKNIHIQMGIIFAHKPSLQSNMWKQIVENKSIYSSEINKALENLMEGAPSKKLLLNQAITRSSK